MPVSAHFQKKLRVFTWLALAAAAVCPAACVRERTLFDATGGSAGALGAASAGDDTGGNLPFSPAAPWDEKSCVAALSQGQTGDACVSSFTCSATANCCQLVASCNAGTLAIKTACDKCVESCTVDADCGAGRLCEAYECSECPTEVCPATWNSIQRNGCSVCVPPSQCKSAKADPSCAEEQICMAGLTCLSGCKDDPACCFGNQCSSSKCVSLDGADCLTVGCPPGSICKVSGEPVACKCDESIGKWVCQTPPQNLCVPR